MADRITFDQFKAVELRVATILEAERVEGTDKLLRLQIDLGSEKRQIVAGIAEVYRPDTLPGKQIVVVVNLEPATIRGVESNGMLLAANIDGRPELVTFDRRVKPGTPIT
jgi:methionine--tRNA ligase beta chain